MFFHDIKLEKELIFEKRIDSDVDHELHMHDLLEINVLLENSAEFRLLDRQYIGDSGDVFIFRPYDPHYNLVKEPAKPITWIMVLFWPSIIRLNPYGYRLLYPFYTSIVHPHIIGSTTYAQSIHSAAKKALEEQEKQLPAWESRQFMYFIDILSTIYRYAMDQQSNEGNLDIDSGVISAVIMTAAMILLIGNCMSVGSNMGHSCPCFVRMVPIHRARFGVLASRGHHFTIP
jgi:hypothetical protein